MEYNSVLCLTCIVLGTWRSNVHAEPITFKDCTGGQQTLSVDVRPCPVQPCSFGEKDVATVTVTFKSPQASNSLKAQIYGYVAGIRVPWATPKSDGCQESNITCPIVQDETYTYVSVLAVPTGAPKIRLVVEWLLLGAGGEKQFCFDFPMSIT